MFPLPSSNAPASAPPGGSIDDEADPVATLRLWLARMPGRIAAVSSFGADSALLLSMIAGLNPTVPVLFLDTHQHFPETLEYQRRLVASLGLADVRLVHPSPSAIVARDLDGQLHVFEADACCALRKVEPLEQALVPFAAWITGRRRDQAQTRRAMPVVEHENGRIKVNPLAAWTAAQVEAETVHRALPRHPLAGRGYKSIGCACCPAPVRPGADPRSGRWAGSAKTECGLHRPTLEPGVTESRP